MTVEQEKQTISPSQSKAARALLGWSQQDLAQNAGIATSTVADFERGQRTPTPANSDAIKLALEKAAISFLPGGAVIGRSIRISAVSGKGTPVRYVDITDLSHWADRRDSQSLMPELISRLIRTEKGFDAILQFPSNEAVSTSGWDGFSEVKESSEYIPSGATGWEIGTQKTKIRAKADEDFSKRTAQTEVDNRLRTVFVFITPRKWAAKKKWAKERADEHKWLDVRAYDGNDLVHWIELLPAVGHWLATHIGKRPGACRDIEEVWQDWSLSTKWPMSSEIVLAGRDKESARLLRWLYAAPSVLTVEAEDTAEALAFLYSSIDQLPLEYRDYYLYRCLAAEPPDARRLADGMSSLILALEDPDAGFAANLAQKGHHVYAVITSKVTNIDPTVCLPKAPHEEFENALIGMGIDKTQANNLARDSARSLTVLRRLIPSVAALKLPKWAEEPEHAIFLIPALLAGAWNERQEGDRKALARLAGSDYETVITRLTPWLAARDAPLKKAGSIWKIVCPLDVWFRLAPHFTEIQIDSFASVLTDVLGASDPRFKMDSEERWLANVRGQTPACSTNLQTGMADSLILLSLYGDQLPAIQYGSRRAEVTVRTLLRGATAERWWSLSALFRRLAEASPDGFLEAVDESLTSSEPPVMALFKEDGGFMGGAYHSELLWALEALAWSPQYLPRCAELLARLAHLDPGGKYANRPNESLLSIFRLWMPQTNASLETRLKVLDRLRRIEPGITWKLMLALLPSNHDIASPSPQPRWRDFSTANREVVTFAVIRSGAEKISEALLKDVGADTARWEELIKHYPQFSPDQRKEVLAKLAQVIPFLAGTEARSKISTSIRQLLHHHRSFPDTHWALPGTELDDIEQLYTQLEADNPIDKWSWLFSDYSPALPRPVPNNWRENEILASNLRRKAVEQLVQQNDTVCLFELVRRVKFPHLLGHELAKSTMGQDMKRSIVTTALSSKEPSIAALAQSMIATQVSQHGSAWVSTFLTDAVTEQWPNDVVVRLLLALPVTSETWMLATGFGDEIEKDYWTQVPLLGVENDSNSIQIVIDKLIAVGRPRNACELAAYNKAKIPSELIVRLLAEAAKTTPSEKDPEHPSMFLFAVEELFHALDQAKDVPQETIASLEWSYLSLLKHSRRPPVVLHTVMSSTPEFFLEVLAAAFHPANRERPSLPPEEAERANMIASHAYGLLSTWNKIPGETAGTIDSHGLLTWIERARRLCSDVDRAAIGDQSIGAVLASSPNDPDGAWPAIPVREVIENVRSHHLELGLQIAIHNNRGMTSRGPFEGGQQERLIANQYRGYSKATALDWPRTSALLENIARSFEDDAKMFDNNAVHTDWTF